MRHTNSNQTIMHSQNRLKSEAEEQFRKEVGKEEIPYTPIKWITEKQLLRFFLYTISILVVFMLGTLLQGFSLSIGKDGFHIMCVLPKFENYLVLNWVLQVSWWFVLLIAGYFVASATLTDRE